MNAKLPTDTYYRGYRISHVREGKPSETFQIRFMGDPELISLTTDLQTAKDAIDEWQNPK